MIKRKICKNENIVMLRKYLLDNNLDGYLLKRTGLFDEDDSSLNWLTNFKGFMGECIILKNKAVLIVNQRYINQAQEQINKDTFDLFHNLELDVISWLKKNAGANTKIGYDEYRYSINEIEILKKQNPQIDFIPTGNIIYKINSVSSKKVSHELFLHDIKYSGETSTNKIKRILKDNIEWDYYIFTQSVSLGWLLNIRVKNKIYIPTPDGIALLSKTGEIYLHLKNTSINSIKNIKLKNISIINDVEEFYKLIKDKCMNKTVYMDAEVTPMKIKNLLKDIPYILKLSSDPTLLKRSILNNIEQKGMKNAHIQDGIAMVNFLYWLKNNTDKKITESSAAEKLYEFRKERKLFFSKSFPSISAVNENGAKMSYLPQKHKDAVLKNNSSYLIDSGAHYLNGTTDITRTIAIGKPSKKAKEYFTISLKTHILLANAVFPKGTKGKDLNTLAHYYIWKTGNDFVYGAGHGVGYFSDVHDGLQGFYSNNNCVLQEGMVLSNEPGIYIKKEFGVRFENLMLIKPSKYKNYLEFETLTLCPIDQDMLDYTLLTKEEKKWITDYQKLVFKKLSSHLTNDIKKWLENTLIKEKNWKL